MFPAPHEHPQAWASQWFGRPGSVRERVLLGIGLAILVGMTVAAVLATGATFGGT